MSGPSTNKPTFSNWTYPVFPLNRRTDDDDDDDSISVSSASSELSDGHLIASGSTASISYYNHPSRVHKSAVFERGDHVTQDMKNERKVYEEISPHPRMLKYIGHMDDDESGGTLVFEYHPRGTLSNKLQNCRGRAPRQQWAVQITEGLAYMHSKGYLHGDLSTRNILLTNDDDVVLCDLACALPIGSGADVPCVTTGVYRPRPDGMEEPYLRYVDDDLFALASVLFEIYAGEEVFFGMCDEDITERFLDREFPEELEYIPAGYIILKCWKGEYLTADEVLADLLSFAENRADPMRSSEESE